MFFVLNSVTSCGSNGKWFIFPICISSPVLPKSLDAVSHLPLATLCPRPQGWPLPCQPPALGARSLPTTRPQATTRKIASVPERDSRQTRQAPPRQHRRYMISPHHCLQSIPQPPSSTGRALWPRKRLGLPISVQSGVRASAHVGRRR